MEGLGEEILSPFLLSTFFLSPRGSVGVVVFVSAENGFDEVGKGE